MSPEGLVLSARTGVQSSLPFSRSFALARALAGLVPTHIGVETCSTAFGGEGQLYRGGIQPCNAGSPEQLGNIAGPQPLMRAR